MAIILAGTSMYDFVAVGDVGRQTSGSLKYPGVTEALSINNPGYIQIDLNTGYTELWTSFYLSAGTVSLSGYAPGFGFYDSSISTTKPLFNIANLTPGHRLALYRDDGNTGANPVLVNAAGESSTLVRIDVHIKIHPSTGFIRVYHNGILLNSYSGNTDVHSGAGIDMIKAYRINGQITYISALMVATEDTRPLRMHQAIPSGNGAVSEWSGTYTAINDTSDDSVISTNTVDAISTFTFPNIGSEYANYDVRAVALSIRGAASGSPGDIKGVARISSTNYTADCIDSFNGVIKPNFALFENNPATTSAWTISEVNSAQFGVKAA